MTNDRSLEVTLPDWAYEMAPCLKEGPYAVEASYFVAKMLEIPEGNYADYIKGLVTYNLAHERDYLDKNWNIEPIEWIKKALIRLGDFAQSAKMVEPPVGYPHIERPQWSDIKDETSNHYGNLFTGYQEEKYYEEPAEFLRQRLERNGYPMDKFSEMTALDDGCGSGRYTVGLQKLGFKHVTGFDWGTQNLAYATERRDAKDIQNIEYIQGNVLDLPFDDNTFDFVLSNGVLHHTEDPDQGVKELIRVLKPGGIGMIMMIPNPGGLHWDVIDILRVVLKGMDYTKAYNIFSLLGVPQNRHMFFLDHMMVPINIYYSHADLEKVLSEAGAVNLRFLERGHDIDRVEWVYQGKPYAKERYGMGDNRYYFEKPKN